MVGLGVWMLGCGAPPAEAPASPPVAAAVDGPVARPVAAPEQGRPPPPVSKADVSARIGVAAPAWTVQFAQGTGPTLEELRGQVVLLRFWTDTCPFCRATAPALVAIDKAYRDRGVAVVGMYHPKPRGSTRTAEAVAAVAADYGFSFPIGLDIDWSVLDAYWLSLPGRRFTSVTFIIDATGTIRFVHPGPEFHPGGPAAHAQCRADYDEITGTLDALLAERAAAAGGSPAADPGA